MPAYSTWTRPEINPGDWERPSIRPGDYPLQPRSHVARRGDDIERWLAGRLQAAKANPAAWDILGALLLEYQRCADAGDPLPIPTLPATDLDGAR